MTEKYPSDFMPSPHYSSDTPNHDNSAPQRFHQLDTAARILALSVGILALIVLVGGWWLDIAVLRTAAPEVNAGLSRTTAVSFLLISVALYLTITPRKRLLGIRVTLAIALVVIAFAVGDLAALAYGVRGGLETLLFAGSTRFAPIYMSPATAVEFLIASVALILKLARPRQAGLYYSLLCTFGLITAVLALTGYAYDVSALYSVSFLTAMAIHTAFGFAALFLGLLCAEPQWTWMGVVAGEGEGSKAVRRLLPAMLGLPFLLGWAALYAIRNEIFSQAFNIALVAIISMGALSALLLRSGRLQNLSERMLRTTNRRLNATLEHREVLLGEVYHRTKNNLQLIDSMLTLEALRLEGDEGKKALARSSERARALALVHQMLLQDTGGSRVDIRQLLTALCEQTAKAAGAAQNGIEVQTDVDADEVAIERAAPLGLVVDELLTNAFRHAFIETTQRAQIEVVYRVLDSGDRELVVRDNGIGYKQANPNRWEGIGWRIVRNLVAQMGGRLNVSTLAGTEVKIFIPSESVEGNNDNGQL